MNERSFILTDGVTAVKNISDAMQFGNHQTDHRAPFLLSYGRYID